MYEWMEDPMWKTLMLAAAGATLLAGCTDPQVMDKLNEIDEKLTEMNKRIPGAGAPAQPEAADPEAERAAGALLQAVNKAMEAGEIDEAKAKLAELKAKHGATRTARAAARVEAELNVFGKDAMALNVDKWHQGNVDIADGKATLLVFWEVWCPHCKREVPKMQKIHDDYGPKGLQVVGLTKQSRDKSDADVMAFLEENDVKYPTARENGDISTHYGVRGVPAAAVVKDGKVVWRGHPSRITPAMMDGWTGS
jgi:thiol-disulfide isomerase/thioredoxin